MKYELINFCEFDKYAQKAYALIHNESQNKNLGDITKVNKKEVADFNVMVGGSPCQDFSVAGKQEGAKWTCKDCKYEYNPLEAHYSTRNKCPKCESENIEKTRSSLLVEWLRILREKKPNLAVYENVKNIVGKQFKQTFDLFEKELRDYGYNTYWKILNAKDYGVPQNRERVYLIIIRKELDNGKFKFPEGFDNGIRLKDILESTVDEKYYISQEKTDKLIELLNPKHQDCIKDTGFDFTYKIDKNNRTTSLRSNSAANLVAIEEPKIVQKCGDRGQLLIEPSKVIKIGNTNPSGNGMNGCVYSEEGISPTVTTNKGEGNKILQIGVLEIKHTELPCILDDRDKGFGIKTSDVCPTQRAERFGIKCIQSDNRIRKLTPLECFRLMDFDDQDYYILKENGISDTQIYKMTGNSIVVSVLYYIFLEIYKAMPYLLEDIKLSSFFSGIGAFESSLKRLQNNINNKIVK